MGICFKNPTLKKSKINNKPIINLIETRKNDNVELNLNKNESLIKTSKNDNKNEIEDKYLVKSALLNIKTKKINKKNILEKSEENIDKSFNLKILIKSQYILKKIFFNLDEKRKLLVLKYNKYYHKLMKINIDNYIKVSGKIKIDGINGYGKEYELNELKLIFEGYYMNGKRNGEGKEYNNYIIFKGEFINGIKNGNAIEYFYDNYKFNLIFKGEYLNGKRWNGIFKEYHNNNSYFIKFDGGFYEGKKIGKEYDINGQLIFEGEYLDNKKWNGTIYNNGFLFKIKNGNGKVEEYDEYGVLIFEGEYLNGEKKGKEYDTNGILLFEGEYLNEKRWNGKIKEYIKHKKSDPFCCNIICGFGMIDYEELIKEKNIQKKLKKYKNKLKYEDEYLNGKRNGKGKEYDINGKIINEVEYLNGKIKVVKDKSNSDEIDNYLLVFEGDLKNGIRNGKGKEYDKNGELIFEGEYLDNKRWNGNGKEFDYKENLIFEGDYLNGKRWEGIIYNKEENLEFRIKNGNSKVKEYLINKYNKIIFEGEYINGEKNGKEKIFSSNGVFLFDGQYLNGKKTWKNKGICKFAYI